MGDGPLPPKLVEVRGEARADRAAGEVPLTSARARGPAKLDLTYCSDPDKLPRVADKETQGTESVRRPNRRKDSLISHCVARAMIAAKGWDETLEQFEAGTLKVSSWQAARVAPKGARVAGFVVMWAVAMRDEGRDEFTITEYQRYWNEGERQTYRLQKEFRECWPEFDTPNELARQVVKYVDSKLGGDTKGRPPLSVPVLA